jgi:hypothetical protein
MTKDNQEKLERGDKVESSKAELLFTEQIKLDMFNGKLRIRKIKF